jgi:hypothetical protein
MSCSNCGSKTAGCGCTDTAYTTPKVYTCPPDTSCPQPVRCSEFMDAACIFLNDGIADAGIQPGSSLESILQQLILLVTNPGCVDAPGGTPGGGTVTFIDAIWPGNAITIAGGPISNSGTFVFNGNGTSNQYIDGQGNLQTFPAISAPVEFQTNGTPNSTQVLLNLVAGTGITLTESGGSVTIDADANIYTVDNGLSADPTDANNFQLGSETSPGAPLIHDTYIAGSQFRFEINNTNSMFLQGNRVDIEGAAAGAMMLSTGGAADNSVEVTSVQVALDSTSGAATTKIFLDPLKIRIQTPLYNLKNDGDVLTLIDKTTGEVEYMPVVGVLLQTDGSDNADQTLLNLVSGNGITLTNVGGDVTIDGPTFQTNGIDNSTQTLLNLVAGTGITLTEVAGAVTIDAAAPAIVLTTNDPGGPATYNPLTGELNIPIYNYQIDIQEEGSSVYTNPEVINFIGTAVTATPTPTGVDVTITGAEYNGNEGIWKETSSLPETFMLGAPYGSGNTIPFTESREVNVDAYNLTFTGSANAAYTLYAFNTAGTALVGGAIYAQADAANQTGVYANAPLGTGFYATAGEYGVVAFTTGSDYNTILDVTPTDTTNISTVLDLSRNNADTAGAGLQIINKINQSPSSVLVTTAQTYGVGDTVTASNFEIQTVGVNPTITTNFTIKGTDGEIQFNQYGLGTFSNVAAYVLGVDASGNVVETTVAGLAISVDTVPFSSSTAIDFVSSADINVTDLGGGQITFDLVNPPVTYDSNEGVYNDSDIFKLGAPNAAGVPGGSSGAIPFGIDREVNTDTHTLFFTGTAIANQYVLDVTNTVGYGIKATSNLGIAIDAFGASGSTVIQATSTGTATGVLGSSKNKYGGAFQSTNLIGLSTFTESTYPSAVVTQTPLIAATASQVLDTLSIYRGVNAPGPVALLTAGGGSAILTALDGLPVTSVGGTSTAIDASRLVTKWFTAQSVSEFSIETKNAASTTLDAKFTILGGGTSGPFSLLEGQIKFNKYAAGAIYKSANDLSTNSGFNLGIDANGNIWATDFSTTTGPVSGVSSISIGTLTNGATATISNPSGPAASVNITGQNAYTQITADSGTASADVYNSQFSVVGADGITTSVTNNPMPASDVITVTGPDKYLSFVTKNISGTTIQTYTPTIWNETLNIQAGSGITITDGGSPNTIIISGGAGTGTVSNVSGVNANGFTVGVTNGTTTPAITVGTSITGVLVGNGTSVSAVSGTGVMVFSGTGYTFQPFPTVNDGQIVLGANAAGLTNTSVALVNSAGGAFTANKATNSTYLLQIGPAIANLVTLMTAVMPTNPPVSGGAVTALPPYIVKTGQDTYTVQTPVTTFSPGSTGFTITSLVSTATTGPLNGAVVLGGTLNVGSGGTGTTTAPGPGQILIGNSTGGYSVATITGGTGITVNNSSGSIQISATGITPAVLNGVHIHTSDGSIRLGSGTTGDVITPLIELTDVRLNSQIYRLSNNNTGYITEVGFQIDDTTKQGFFGSSASTSATTANVPQVGFIFTGNAGTALTTYNGVYIDRSSLGGVKVISGFSSGVTETLDRAANSIYQQGPWGGAVATSKMYEAIPSARTIQFGDISLVGNSNYVTLNDASSRLDINKAIVYGTGYGAASPVGLDGATTARYLLATSSNGKFYEFEGRSISQITGNSGTFSAASMASATAPVAFSIQGSGTISTSVVGNVLTISNSATAFPYWSTLNLTAAAGGTVLGDANVIPNTVGANTLNLVAGSGITLTGTDSSNTIQISAGTVNAWYNIAVAGQSNLVPDAAQDTLTFAAGTGIQLTTNATTDTLTITSTGITSISNGGDPSISVSTVGGVTTITGNYNSNNGIIESGGNTFQLGAPTSQANALATVPFTADRFINGNTGGFKLDMESPVAAGRGVLHLTVPTTGVGRALRAVNNNTSGTAEGAIYALAVMDASPDATPTGTIYAESTAKGHAVVGVSNGAAGDAVSGVFGKGRQGVKGYTDLAAGYGVYAEALDTILGYGIFSKAKGEYNTANSYAGWFAIDPTNNANRVEVLRLDRTTSNGSGGTISGDFGGTIGYYLEAASGTTTRAGQVGYTWGKTQVGDSRFKVSVVKASSPATAETVRLELRETGQLFLSRYFGIDRVYPAATGPANQDKGPFVPESGTNDNPVGAGYAANVYDYLVPGSKAYASATDEEGRMDTLRNTQGKFNPALTVSGGGAAITSPAIRNAFFTRLNNVVHGTVRLQFGAVLGALPAGGSIDIVLPVWPDASFAVADDLIGSAISKLNVAGNVAAQGRFDNITVAGVVGTNNKMRLSFTVPVAQTAGITNEFTIQFMYTLY